MTNSLHNDALIIDGHCDSIGEQLMDGRWLGTRSEQGHIDLPRLKEGGVDVQFFACYVPTILQRHGATTHAMERLDQLHLLAEQHPEEFTLVRTAAEIRQAKREGKIAGVAGLEGAECLDASLGILRQFYRLGVRNVGLAWNHRNAACDGVAENRTGGGLTEFGVQVVEECNRLGMMLDVSHLSPAGITDTLAVSHQPILATHSNVHALCDHPRNLTDAQIDAIAKKGGVIGVTFVNVFLNQEAPEQTSIDDVIAHIDYLLARVGPDHVAIGSDFDGCDPPTDLNNTTAYPRITEKLIEQGHPESVIRQIVGENFLRVFEEICG